MNFKEMQYLQKIAQCQSYRQAAEELYVSQPALTQTVQAVEREYGTTLFQRVGGRSVPTEEGRLILESAARTLRILQELEESFALAASQSPPVVLVLSAQVVPSYYATASLPLRENIRLEQILSHQDWTDSVFWDLNLDICRKRPRGSEWTVLREVGICCVMDQNHPLARSPAISCAQLGQTPLLLPPHSSAARNDIDGIFKACGFVPNLQMESDNYHAYGDFLRDRDWVALAPDYTAGLQDLPGLALVPWSDFGQGSIRYLCLRQNKNKTPTEQVGRVRRQLIRTCSTEPPENF